MPPKDSLIQIMSGTYNGIAKSDPADALHFVEHIDDCTKAYTHDENLQGHNKECHVAPDACGSKLLYLRRLAPYFPNVRTIVSMLYTVKKTTTTIKTIDKAFPAEDVAALEQVITKRREITKNLYHLSSCAVDKCKIREDFSVAFNARNLLLRRCYRNTCVQTPTCRKSLGPL